MNKYYKVAMSLLLIGLGVWAFVERENGLGVMLVILSVIPVFLFFRNEYILLGFWYMRKQDLVSCKKWLSKITNPDAQLFKQHGYFYYMLGLSESQENAGKTEQLMKKALGYGLNFAHDRAMANLNLAAAAMSKGKKREAELLLKKAEKEDDQKMLQDQIKMMKEQMKKVNVGRNLQNPHMRNRGKYF